MLELIDDYELSRFQLQKRICELNKMLLSPSLQTIERENLTVRRAFLVKERSELLETILELKSHLGKEELIYAQTHPCTGIRS